MAGASDVEDVDAGNAEGAGAEDTVFLPSERGRSLHSISSNILEVLALFPFCFQPVQYFYRNLDIFASPA